MWILTDSPRMKFHLRWISLLTGIKINLFLTVFKRLTKGDWLYRSGWATGQAGGGWWRFDEVSKSRLQPVASMTAINWYDAVFSCFLGTFVQTVMPGWRSDSYLWVFVQYRLLGINPGCHAMQWQAFIFLVHSLWRIWHHRIGVTRNRSTSWQYLSENWIGGCANLSCGMVVEASSPVCLYPVNYVLPVSWPYSSARPIREHKQTLTFTDGYTVLVGRAKHHRIATVLSSQKLSWSFELGGTC